MSSIGQYLKDTRAELRHVAWPTQTQTIIYTVLVALISVGIALYLGLFDFLFTTGLTRTINALPQANPITATHQPSSPNDVGVQIQGIPVTTTTGTTSSTSPGQATKTR